MSNDYYENLNPVTRQTLARADAIEAKFDAVEAAFDLLPAPALLASGAAGFGTATGTNTYAVTVTGIAAYTTGMRVAFVVPNANTTSCLINVNGLGNKAFKRGDGTNYVSGDLPAGAFVEAYYDGSEFRNSIGDGLSFKTAAAASAAAAASSASAASSSASAASSSASAASTSASNASTSATNAANSASAAATSATNAATSATTAATNVATALTSIANGSAAAPSVTFLSDNDTGLHRVGANELGFDAGGALQASVDTSGLKLASGKTLRNSAGIIIAGNSPEDLLLESTILNAGSDTYAESVNFAGYGYVRVEIDGIQLTTTGGGNFSVSLRDATNGVNSAFFLSSCDTMIGTTAAAADRYSGTLEYTIMETLFAGTRYVVNPHVGTFVGYRNATGGVNRVAGTVGCNSSIGPPTVVQFIIAGGPFFVQNAGSFRVYGRRRA